MYLIVVESLYVYVLDGKSKVSVHSYKLVLSLPVILSQNVRVALSNACMKLAPKLGQEHTMTHILPMLLAFLRDESAEVGTGQSCVVLFELSSAIMVSEELRCILSVRPGYHWRSGLEDALH